MQLAQEPQHIMIRMETAGAFKRKCGDHLIVRNTFQTIMNAVYIQWDPIKSPPILHRRRKAKNSITTLAYNQYHPYEMFSKTKYLKQPALFPYFRKAMLALWQSRNTKDPLLKAQLLDDQRSKALPRSVLIDQLKYCVQNTPKEFQLCWPSVKNLPHYIALYFITLHCVIFQYITPIIYLYRSSGLA